MNRTPIEITITKLEMTSRPSLRPMLPHGQDNGRVMLLKLKLPLSKNESAEGRAGRVLHHRGEGVNGRRQ